MPHSLLPLEEGSVLTEVIRKRLIKVHQFHLAQQQIELFIKLTTANSEQ